METHNFDTSKCHLKILAQELSENYYDNASIDLYPEQWDNKSQKSQNEELKKVVFNSAHPYISNQPRRNILIMGAGATKNAFDNIPLGGEAITKIQENIIVYVSGDVTIDFDFFLKYYQKSVLNIQSKGLEDFFKGKENKYEYLDNVFNAELKNDNVHYLKSLGKNYFAEFERLRLYSKENKGTKDLDFETSLNILVTLFDLATIRTLIKKLYNYSYGPTLFYQIVAHLFKNGFIDVVINFNFDELLDRTIAEELDEGSYDYIFSDGDCKSLKELEFDGRLRQPLYIKPHGTVSHKSSLKFTKDDYHELPIDMRKFLEEVIGGTDISSNKKIQKRVNLITVGFEMESLEFNEIIKLKLPEKSSIFTLFYHEHQEDSVSKLVENKYDKLKSNFQWPEIDGSGETRIMSLKNCPKLYFIGHEYPWPKTNNKIEYATLCQTFLHLFNKIQLRFTDLFSPSQINKHLIISNFFGNINVWSHLNKIEGNKSNFYPKEYFESHHYFKDRVIVESLIHLAVNNGFINVASLMKGSAGYYYAKYLYSIKKYILKDASVKEKTMSIAEILEELMMVSKLNDKNDEIEKIKPLDINYPREGVNLNFIDRIINGAQKEHFSEKHLGAYLGQLMKDGALDTTNNYFEKIVTSNNTRIQSKLRSTIHNTFSDYGTTDLISNSLLHDLYFYNDLTQMSNTIAIYSIVDYGHQLKKFLSKILKENNKIKFKLILQYNFDSNSSTKRCLLSLKKKATKNIISNTELTLKDALNKFEIYFLNISGHNHHMTLFLNNESMNGEDIGHKVNSAVYYYKNGLSTNINPIRIDEVTNKAYLREKFEDYIYRSIKFMKGIDENYVKSLNEKL